MDMIHIFTDRMWSMGEGNIFTGICHSVHREGILLHGLFPEGDLLPGCVWVGVWLGGVWLGGVWSEMVGVWSEGGRQTPPLEMATATVGTHPTGIHSC